jgi:hypothetical protein
MILEHARKSPHQLQHASFSRSKRPTKKIVALSRFSSRE